MRGLHPGANYDIKVPGIIPARAGFTAEKRTPVYVAEDHPRACGVYELPPAAMSRS